MTMQGSDMREIRQGLGLTIEQAAQALGLSPTIVGQMERGTAPIEKRTVRQVEDSLCPRIDVMHSEVLGGWLVTLVRPIARDNRSQPPGREHKILAKKSTRSEAASFAEEERQRHPGARVLVHPGHPA